MERNGMTIPAAIKLNGYEKHFDGFDLGPLEFEIPAGFTTALIGENGAGKTTLLDALGGITSGRGKITWLEKYTDLDQNNGEPRNEIDMESIVDYVVFLTRGRVIAKGFVEDLREQYRYVHGPKDALGTSKGTEAFDFYYFDDDKVEGLCSVENAEKFEESFAVEVPTLQQLSVLILRSGE